MGKTEKPIKSREEEGLKAEAEGSSFRPANQPEMSQEEGKEGSTEPKANSTTPTASAEKSE